MQNDTREMTIWFSSSAGSETCTTAQYESCHAQNEIFKTTLKLSLIELLLIET